MTRSARRPWRASAPHLGLGRDPSIGHRRQRQPGSPAPARCAPGSRTRPVHHAAGCPLAHNTIVSWTLHDVHDSRAEPTTARSTTARELGPLPALASACRCASRVEDDDVGDPDPCARAGRARRRRRGTAPGPVDADAEHLPRRVGRGASQLRLRGAEGDGGGCRSFMDTLIAGKGFCVKVRLSSGRAGLPGGAHPRVPVCRQSPRADKPERRGPHASSAFRRIHRQLGWAHTMG